MGGGGMRGMFGNGNARKYSLNFNVQALNLFNNIDLGPKNGGITPTLDSATGVWTAGPQFGRSTSLAGGMFSTSSAARRVFLQMSFQF